MTGRFGLARWNSSARIAPHTRPGSLSFVRQLSRRLRLGRALLGRLHDPAGHGGGLLRRRHDASGCERTGAELRRPSEPACGRGGELFGTAGGLAVVASKLLIQLPCSSKKDQPEFYTVRGSRLNKKMQNSRQAVTPQAEIALTEKQVQRLERKYFGR
jgi:hypothetical protein